MNKVWVGKYWDHHQNFWENHSFREERSQLIDVALYIENNVSLGATIVGLIMIEYR